MTENTRDWLSGYLRRRAYLASEASDFQCEPDCTRPGCKSPDLQVPVSLVDLFPTLVAAGYSYLLISVFQTIGAYM